MKREKNLSNNYLHKKINQRFENSEAVTTNNKSVFNDISSHIITPILKPSKQIAPSTKQWMNGIYSFNKSLIKTLPSTDLIVDRIIKSYFTLNPIASNPNGEKLRLIQRRYKRLSLNRILVSKPEVKHTNNTVYITLHVFNKKRASLIENLDFVYSNLSRKGIFPRKASLNSSIALQRKDRQKITKHMGLLPEGETNEKIVQDYTIGIESKVITRNSLSRIISINRIIKPKVSNLISRDKLKKSYLKLRKSFILNSVSKRGKKWGNFNKRFKGLNRQTPYLAREQKDTTMNNRLSGIFSPSVIKVQTLKNISYKNKVSHYNDLNLLLKNKIFNLLVRTRKIKQNKQIMYTSMFLTPMFSNYYNALNKYKLYNINQNISDLTVTTNHTNLVEKPVLSYKNQNQTLFLNKIGLKLDNNALDLSMIKLKAVYKLFTYYSNIAKSAKKLSLLVGNDTKNPDGLLSLHHTDNTPKVKGENIVLDMKLNELKVFSSKILWITSKMLNKFNNSLNTSKLIKDNFTKNPSSNNEVEPLYNVNLENLSAANNLFSKQNNLKSHFSKNNWIASRNNPRVKSVFNKTLSLNGKHTNLNSVNKIEEFLAQYNNILHTVYQNNSKLVLANPSKPDNLDNAVNHANPSNHFLENNNIKSSSVNNTKVNTAPLCLHLSKKNLISVYKLNLINDTLEKELLYLFYIKMLSFNNIVFKNWYLNSLTDILSKLYNKKVILNIINLKYLHLNSDILTQAINIRLKDFKNNSVSKVLASVLKLIFVSKINAYSYNMHSPVYKYIENHYNRFKTLNLEIFKAKASNSNNLNNKTFLSKQNAMSANSAMAAMSVNSAVQTSLSPVYIPKKIRYLNHIQTSTINFIKYKSVFGVKLEARGRLTKRSTASRAVFKFKYKGSLKNNLILNRSNPSVILNNSLVSNLQYSKISSKTRNGSFGLKGWINNL